MSYYSRRLRMTALTSPSSTSLTQTATMNLRSPKMTSTPPAGPQSRRGTWSTPGADLLRQGVLMQPAPSSTAIGMTTAVWVPGALPSLTPRRPHRLRPTSRTSASPLTPPIWISTWMTSLIRCSTEISTNSATRGKYSLLFWKKQNALHAHAHT